MNDEWEFTPLAASSGIFVQRDGRRGFAKLNDVGREKLASDLAKLVNVSVPAVENCQIQGTGPYAVSEVHHSTKGSLRNDELTSEPYLSEEQNALKAASGLLPFFAWIAAEDHYKDENLIIDDLGEAGMNVSAIDFEHAFSFARETQSVTTPTPPAFKANFDTERIGASLANILDLAEDDIRSCCAASADWLDRPDEIAEALIVRRTFLRQAMIDAGWLA